MALRGAPSGRLRYHRRRRPAVTALADASIFIAREQDRPVAAPPPDGMPVVTQDTDYDDVPGLRVVKV